MFEHNKLIACLRLLAKVIFAGSVFLWPAVNALADLQITKTVDPISPSPAAENDVVRYNLSVTNTGPGNLSNVIIDDVPDNLNNLNYTVTSPGPPPGSAGPGANQYRFFNLPAGETVTLDLDATVNAVDACPLINNTASVSEGSGTFNDSATAASIEYDFELTSGPGSNVITHVAGTSYCEFCDTGEIHIRITNPTTAAFQNITLAEDLQSLGLTYISGSTTSTIGGAADPSISGTQLTWTSAQIPALASLAAGNTLEISFRVSTYTEAMILADPNRNIIASMSFDMACLAGSQLLDTGQFELPIRQPVPQLLKQARNYDAAQNTWANTVYGNQNDDVIWRVRVRNQGAADMEALLMNDAITGNFDINYICPTLADANAIGANNGVLPGASPCVAMATPFDVDDPFGNIADPNDIAATSDGFIYYVGRILTDHTNHVNTADISWGCEVTSPGGGLITVPASTGGSTPAVNLDDTANLSTTVVPASLQITQTVTGSNPGQPLGTKGLMTITLNNQTGGSIQNIEVSATLPAGYVMDNSYGVVNGVGSGQPTFARTPAFQNYPGFIDTFTRDDAELGTPDPLDDLTPHFTLTSTTTGADPLEQVNMLRHDDEVSFTFGIIMVEPGRFDKEADSDVNEENTGDNTDPTSALALSNDVTVSFDAVDDPSGVQGVTLPPVTFNYNSNPEDLDVDISDSLFILTNDVNVPLDLNVILTNNGGHDADDHVTYVSFGQTMTVQTPASGCVDVSPPPPSHPYWSTPATIPATAAVYACDRGVLAPGASETFTFSVIKNTSGAGISADDLTFRADVIGEITHFDGSLLTDPTPAILTWTTPQQQLANNYTLDTIRSRVLGFNLTKVLSGNCAEDNPPPITNTNVIIGEDCPWHIESGGWFGFLTPGYTLIAVEDVVVTDDLPNGQGFIHYDNVKPFNFTNDPAIVFVGANGGAGTTPLDETDIDWQFNAAINPITTKDQFFRVDLKTRILNDPVDSSAAPNSHSAISTNIGRTSFNAHFQSANVAGVPQPPLFIPVSDTLGIPGYPLESVRRVDLTVTEPNITITKQVCNETRNGFGPGCNGGVFADLVNDGDTTDSYIFKITLTNEVSASGVARAPAYNIISTDVLDASDLMLVVPFASDGLDNDGDGLVDAADINGEGSISENVANGTTPAIITYDSTHSAPLLRVDPGDSVTFYYRVDPDDAIAPFQLLTNTVDMSYDSLDGDFGNQSAPQLDNTAVAPDDAGRARIYTTAPASADVRIIPVLTEPKSIVQLSNTPVGGPPQPVVPGEEIEYKLVASLPAANLRDFKIRDELPPGIRCIEGQVVNLNAAPYTAAGFSPGGSFAPSTCTSTGSNDVIEWQFGDQALTALLPGDRFDFEITFIARVENTAFTGEGTVISNGDPSTVTTTSYKNESGTLVVIPHAAVDVVVREPQISLTKSFAPVVNSDAGDVLTVTVTATNTGSASAYNLRVLDDLLGSDLSYVVGSVSGTDPPDNVDLSLGANQPIFSWNPANTDYEIAPAAVRSFTFKVRVDNTAQPLELLDNTLQAAWSSLPGQSTALNTSGVIGADGSVLGLRNGALPNAGNAVNNYETTATASTVVPPLTMTKTVIAPAVDNTIGAHKHFQIEILLPEGTTNNLVVSDDLNQGSLSYVLANNAAFDISYSFQGIASVNGGALTEGSFTFPADNTAVAAAWDFGTVVTLSEDDLSTSNITPSILIDYYARADNVLPEANEGDTMQNTAAVDYTNGETSLPAPQLQDSTAPVTVVEPDNIAVSKTYVANLTNPGVAPDLNDVLQYRITVTNNDSIEAFDFNIRDELPAELQLDTAFIPTALINGVAVTGFNATPAASPAGPLVWGRGNADNTLDIPPGQSLVLTYQAIVKTLSPLSTVLSNSVYVDWTSLDGDSVYERTGAGCPAITAPNDYCVGPVTAMVALVEPELTLEKRGPAGTVSYGVGIPYTLVLENTGNGTAFGARVIDKLPDAADNPPLTGGTCDTAPQNFNVRITSAADESTVLRALTQGVDYTVSHTAAPTCELVVDTVSTPSGIVAGEKLLITYDAYLDSGSQGGALLSNIAGVTTWYSQDVSAGTTGLLAFTRTITDGTPGVVDHQDTATVTAEAPIVDVQKTVVNITTGQDPGSDASPGDTLRYTITVSVPNASALDAANIIVSDAVPANASYVADSVTLNGLPLGQPDGGVSPLIAGVEVSSSDLTPPLPSPGNGIISIGESATLTFDVILDPVITSGTVIQNQATASSPATGDLLSDDPLAAGTEDPTETVITSAPAFQVQKTSQDITGDPAVLDAGDSLRYTITVKNIGQENAVNVLLTDQIPSNTVYEANSTTLNGAAVTDPSAGVSAVEVGLLINAPGEQQGNMPADADAAANNVATITFEVTINPSVVDGALISNQGFVTGDGAGSGTFPQQPTDDPGTPLPDDPTIDVVGNVPVVDVLKTVAIQLDINGNGIVDPGDTLRYTITATNIGAIPATGVRLVDNVPLDTTYVANSTTLNGNAVADAGGNVSPLISGIDISSSDLTPPLPGAGNGVLSAGSSALVIFDVVVNAATPAGTVISNQGSVSSNEVPVEPSDADGIDANGDQPTTIVVGNVQRLAITKQVSIVGGGVAQAGGQLEYLLRVTNIGSVAASNVVITDNLDQPVAGQMTYVAGSSLLNGLPAGVSFAAPLLTADYSTSYGDLAPGDVIELRFRAQLNNTLALGTTITNIGEVNWDTPPSTASASVDIDIGGSPGSVNMNGQVWHDTDFNNVLSAGEIVLPNWQVELYRNNVLLANTQTDANGGFQFSGLPPNLPVGDAYELRYTSPGAVANAATLGTASSAFTNGPQRISDILAASGASLQNLNMPRQPNGIVYDSVLRVPVAGATLTMFNQTRSNQQLPASCLEDPNQQNQVTSAEGYYKFDLNFSDPLRCAEGDEYVIQVQPPASGYVGTTSAIIPPAVPVSGAAQNVPVCPGSAADQVPATALHCENSTSEVQPDTSIAPRTAGTSYYLKFLFNSAPYTDQIYNNHIPVDPELDAAVSISKVTGMPNVTRSQLVPYTITLNNALGVPLFDLTVIDNFPAGFKYVAGSSRLDGAEVEPVINGRQLSWPGVSLDANEIHIIKLLLAVGSGVGEGEYVNTAHVINTLTGEAASGIASATVRVIPDPTFDCTDIIGKVFDDKNYNGYQDEGEPGLAGVQLATARGLRVTTDPYGRFHITCAVVANEVRGSNFIMKLDDRTLPSGYRVTTENPRVLRATRGKMLKFNFGATIHRVVRLDLADGVFEKDSTMLRPQWRSRIDLLMIELQKDPSILRLSYLGENETESQVEKRLDAIEKLISDRWQEIDCCYKLTIEKEVFWRKGNPSDRKAFK
ncbi:MAG: DUF11 domain-containing protein [Gammaproteobacteria bacterium]|nr:DUF11 domain-containing protein [Gammaproteobacteria bacterium]